MGLDVYLRWDQASEEDKRLQYTGFSTNGKVGYLRSAYNEHGFEYWAEKYMGGKGFAYIFEYNESKEVRTGDEHFFIPNWKESLQRAEAASVEAKQVIGKPILISLSGNKLRFTPRQAIETFCENNSFKEDEVYKVNRDGIFINSEKMKMMGILRGLEDELHVIFEDVENKYHSYFVSIYQDVIDFINLALTKPNAKIVWSG